MNKGHATVTVPHAQSSAYAEPSWVSVYDSVRRNPDQPSWWHADALGLSRHVVAGYIGQLLREGLIVGRYLANVRDSEGRKSSYGVRAYSVCADE